MPTTQKPPTKIEPLTDEQKALVEAHLDFVEMVAKEVRRRSPQFELDELAAYGSNGLMAAAKAFDATKGVQFKTFAYHRVRGAIQDGIRSLVGYSHFFRDRHAAELALEKCREEQQSFSETMERLAEMLHKNPTPRRAPLKDAAEVADGDRSPETQAHVLHLRERVRALVDNLETTERQILEGLYFEDQTLDEARVKAGVSRGWASRKHAKALKNLQEKLAGLK